MHSTQNFGANNLVTMALFGIEVNFWVRDNVINMEIVTKVDPMRAVELSIGAFCIKFLCEQLCDNVTFWVRGQLLGLET